MFERQKQSTTQMCENSNATTSLSQLCHTPWVIGSRLGCFCKIPWKICREKSVLPLLPILFTFQTNFTFYLYCASSQIYCQAVARASWQQPKKLWGPCKLFSSQGSCPITAVGGLSWLHPTSSQASQSYLPAMTWNAVGAEGRPKVQHT